MREGPYLLALLRAWARRPAPPRTKAGATSGAGRRRSRTRPAAARDDGWIDLARTARDSEYRSWACAYLNDLHRIRGRGARPAARGPMTTQTG